MKSIQHSFTQHQLIHYISNVMKYYLVCFVTTLNAAFEQKLALEDEGLQEQF